MRRLVILAAIGILSLTALFKVRAEGSYSQILSLCILLVAAASYYENNLFVVLSVFFPVAVSAISFFYGVQMQPVCIMISAFLLTPAVSRAFRRKMDARSGQSDDDYSNMKISYEKVKHETEYVGKTNQELERQAAETAKLYELTKQMSASLEFEEILKVLCDFVRSNFKYKNAYLFTVAYKDSAPESSKEYRIGIKGEEKLSFRQLDKNSRVPYALRLINMLSAAKAPIRVSADTDKYLMQKLQLTEELSSFIGMPVYARGRIAAVFAFEDAELKDFEGLSIIAGQFSLEMERSLLYEEVQALAIIDGLTNIYVRRHFIERFSEELERSGRHKMHLSVLMIDIDHFKDKNDKFGHLVGDVILKEVAGLIKQNVREIDLVGRYGGEEFSAILVDTDKLDAQAAGERIRKAVETYKFKAYDEVIDITISAGISSFPTDGRSISELIEKADSALYQAKDKGRNKVCIYY